MALKSVDQIYGIPLHYARTSTHPYGTRGLQRNFWMEKDFHETLEACFEEVFTACPLGKPEVITSAGAFVNKPGTHGKGAAIDFDGAFWSDYTMMTTSYPVNVELYLGIESFLRRHFGIVLNYRYNAAHEDHWHIDNSVSTNFSKNSRSKVLYLQMTLRHIYRLDVIVDGLFGPQTEGAYKLVARRLGLRTGFSKAVWMKYLQLTGQVAFALFDRPKSPRGLMEDLYTLVAEQPGSRSQQILEALNAFREHPETMDWLGAMYDKDTILSETIAEIIG